MAEIAGLWDALPSSLYGTSSWLTMQEGHFAQGCAYGMVSGAEGPRVATVSYTMGPTDWELVNPVALLTRDTSSLPGAGGEGNLRVADAVRVLRQAADSLFPAAVSVLPAGYRPGLLHAEKAGPAEFDAALGLLEHMASESGMPTTAVMHVPTGETRTRTALEERGYLPFTTAADCVLDVEWDSLEDYIASFSRSRRTKLRREIRVFRDAGFETFPADPRCMNGEHVDLVLRHLAQYGHAPDRAGITELVERVIRHVGGACDLLEVRRDGSLEAFVLSYDDNGVLQPRMLGLAPEDRKHGVYLNLVYYELIAHAITAGARGISYGPETYEAKALRGCRPDLRVNYVRPPHEYREPVRAAAAAVDLAHRRHIRSQPWRTPPEFPEHAA